MAGEGIAQVLPLSPVKINAAIVQTVELKDTVYSMHSKGTPEEINALGARVVFKLAVNSNTGNQGPGSYFREGGHHTFKQATIGLTYDNISHNVIGDYKENVEQSGAIGGSLKELMADDVMELKRERDIDFCHGDGIGSRGLVSAISGAATSTVTFDGAEGTRLLRKGQTYFFVDPADGAVHGVTTGHVCLTISKNHTQATFVGDVSSGTTVAAGDIAVRKATADNETSWNRALYGFDYFELDSGEYYGLDRDADSEIAGLRVNAGNRNVSFSLLEKGRTMWFYRWNEAAPNSLIDVVPPAQEVAYKLLGYTLRRITEGAKTFDGAINTVTDGNLTMTLDAHLPPSKWHRYDPTVIKRFELRPTGVWNLDGLTYRSIPGNGTHKDEIYWTIEGKEQMASMNPARMISYYNLTYAGAFNGVS